VPNLSIENAQALRDLYVNLMEQIKLRTAALNAVGPGDLMPSQPDNIRIEFAFLQFRLICETIALACLAAHGDISATRQQNIQKAWRPADIMRELEKLHADFYPFPTKQIIGPDGKVLRTEDVTEDFLTKSDLLKLWGQAGNELHMGNIHNILTKRKTLPPVTEIEIWNKKIVTLLNHHQIKLSDPNYQFWVLMHANTDGRVHGTLFRRADAT
jgi:hypothetical protein